jgi:hypothetical protein
VRWRDHAAIGLDRFGFVRELIASGGPRLL